MTVCFFLLLYLIGGLVHLRGLLADARLVGNADVIALADDIVARRLDAEFAASLLAAASFIAVWPVTFVYAQYRLHRARRF
ncbi:hypothetical protein [Ensifer sp.]|uniref:hypothetical protein n=1 Tax=Ensifer sp. TaxID=1872086 RepID=UPI00289E3E72|nr:hypothetical protein [Ensifer sp.]